MAGQEAKYQKIINWVRQEIADGSLRSGDKLPSEKELSERFGLSRQTVRHATGELEAQHIVSRVQGSGTYIGGIRQLVYEPRYMSVAVLSTFYESYIFPPSRCRFHLRTTGSRGNARCSGRFLRRGTLTA